MLHKIGNGVKKAIRKAHAKAADIAEKERLGRREVMSVRDVFFMQFEKQELKRYDIVVRYLAIEHYLGKNDFGFDLYRKMQDARVRAGYGTDAEKQFRALLDSYRKKGYDSGSSIVVDKNLSLVDGSHRVALHLYFGIEDVSVVIMPLRKPVDYSIDWFFQNGFTNGEIDRILAKGRELTEKANTGLSCVIWSPAAALSDAIIGDLSYFGRADGVKRYAFSPEEYRNVVKAIYAADDIADWKIQAKLEHMRQPAPELVAVRFYPDAPDFRLKDATGMPLSRLGERVKKSLRTRYRGQVEDYFFDVIMHIADNFGQSDYMFRVLEPGIDMTEVLRILARYTYALAKTDSPYYPADFPRHIPVGKDVDILCMPQDGIHMARALMTLLNQLPGYEVRLLENPNGTQVRLEKRGHLIFLLDVIWASDDLKGTFFEDALKNREAGKDYMRLSAPYEYLYRMVSYEKHPQKTQHLAYLRNHRADYDPEMLKKYTALSPQIYEKIMQEKNL